MQPIAKSDPEEVLRLTLRIHDLQRALDHERAASRALAAQLEALKKPVTLDEVAAQVGTPSAEYIRQFVANGYE